jgi:cytochrome b pre-mRNA-processing protein 3
MLTWLRQRRSTTRISRALYGSSVSAARAPALYAGLHVPDTLAGRFEMVVLHTFLIMHRLTAEGDAGRALSQALAEAMIEQLDDDYRELGVSDIRVPKKVRQAAAAAYGRFEAYRAAMSATGTEALAAALLKNVYDGDETRYGDAQKLAAHAMTSAEHLARQPAGRLLEGEVQLVPYGGSAS